MTRQHNPTILIFFHKLGYTKYGANTQFMLYMLYNHYGDYARLKIHCNKNRHFVHCSDCLDFEVFPNGCWFCEWFILGWRPCHRDYESSWRSSLLTSHGWPCIDSNRFNWWISWVRFLVQKKDDLDEKEQHSIIHYCRINAWMGQLLMSMTALVLCCAS